MDRAASWRQPDPRGVAHPSSTTGCKVRQPYIALSRVPWRKSRRKSSRARPGRGAASRPGAAGHGGLGLHRLAPVEGAPDHGERSSEERRLGQLSPLGSWILPSRIRRLPCPSTCSPASGVSQRWYHRCTYGFSETTSLNSDCMGCWRRHPRAGTCDGKLHGLAPASKHWCRQNCVLLGAVITAPPHAHERP